jgi:hypothetical protein
MSGLNITADRNELTRFVDALFAKVEPGTFVSLRCFRDNRADEFALKDEWRAIRLNGNLDDLVDAAEDLATLAALADEPVCFAPPICTFNNDQKADEASLARGIAISVELDENPIAGRERLERILGPATVTMESGGRWFNPKTGEFEPKLHQHWRLSRPTVIRPEHMQLKEANDLACRIAGGDPTAKTPVHPMRWAGSVHRKAEPRLAHIVDSDIKREVNLADALNKLRDAASVKKGNGHDQEPPKTFADWLPADLLDLLAAIACIPNRDACWDEWNNMGLRIYAATDGSEIGLDPIPFR